MWTGTGEATVLSGYNTASEDITTDTIIKIAGECAHADDSITQNIFIVDRM